MVGDKLIINGTDVTNFIISDLDSLEIQYGFSQDKTYGYSITTGIKLDKNGFDLLSPIFFNNLCSGISQVAKAQFYDGCCHIWLEFDIESDDVIQCADCTVEFTLTSIPPERKCYNYLSSTVWWKNGYCDNYTGPIMEYVVQLQGAMKLLYYLVELIALILSVLFVLCNIIKYILEYLDFLASLVEILTKPFSGIFGAIGDFLNIGAQWEYSGQGDPDLIPCTQFLQGLSWDGNGTLSQQQIDSICNNFNQAQCEQILHQVFFNGNANNGQLEDIVDMCNAINQRIQIEQSGTTIQDNGIFDLSCDWANPRNIYDLVKGNCRWVQTPKMIDILKYHAAACGLSVNAPILESGCPLMFCLAASGGTDKDDLINNHNRFIKDAASNKTIIQLLDDWSKDYNADYIIKNGVLYFDRVDRIDSLNQQLTTTQDLLNEDRIETQPCLSYIPDNACAYLRPSYCLDTYDVEGNDTLRKMGHDNLIEWNKENSSWKKGECLSEMSSGGARFMHDQITFESSGLFAFNAQIDRLRATNAGSFVNGALGGALGKLLNLILPKGKKTRNALIIGGFAERTSCCKILYMDPLSSNDDAKVVKQKIGNKGGFDHFCYNYPMYMTEDEPNGQYVNNHIINNPNRQGREIARMTNLKFKYTCDDLRSVHNSPCGWFIGTTLGPANIKNIKFNRKSQTATIETSSIRCK